MRARYDGGLRDAELLAGDKWSRGVPMCSVWHRATSYWTQYVNNRVGTSTYMRDLMAIVWSSRHYV